VEYKEVEYMAEVYMVVVCKVAAYMVVEYKEVEYMAEVYMVVVCT
jgi:hypothetical protein